MTIDDDNNNILDYRHMADNTLKVKNGLIRLPNELRQAWKEAMVYVSGNRDTITLKRLSKSSLSFSQMLDEFKKTASSTKLTRRDVAKTIAETRKH